MRTTVKLNKDLVTESQKMTGTQERTALIHAGLRALIERESARRLARLGGSEPHLSESHPEEPPRRRSAADVR